MMLIDEYNASYMYMYKLINQLTSDCNYISKCFWKLKNKAKFYILSYIIRNFL